MAGTLGVLRIASLFETKSLQNQLDQASGKLKGWASKVEALSPRAAGFFNNLAGKAGNLKAGLAALTPATAAVAAAFAALAVAAKLAQAAINLVNSAIAEAQEQAGEIDRIAKYSAAIGFQTETMVGLEHAAALTGAELSNLQDGLKDFTKNMGGAAVEEKKLAANMTEAERAAQKITGAISGAGGAAGAFEQLGLSAQELQRQSPEDAFLATVDALKAIENPSQRVDVAMKVMGESALKLQNLIAAGSDGIRDMTKEAEELGIAFNMEEARRVEDMNDALDKMKKLWTGIGRKIAVEFAPIITAIANMVTDLGKSFKDDLGEAIAVSADVAVEALAWVLDALNVMQAAWHTQQGAASKFWQVVIGGAANAAEAMGQEAEFLRAWEDTLGHQAQQSQEKAINAWTRGTGDRLKALVDKLRNNLAEIDPGDVLSEEDAEALLKRFEELSNKATSMFEATRTPLEKWKAELAELEEMQSLGIQVDADTLARHTDAINEELLNALNIEPSLNLLDKYEMRLDQLKTALDAGVIDDEELQAQLQKFKQENSLIPKPDDMQTFQSRMEFIAEAWKAGLIDTMEQFEKLRDEALPAKMKSIIDQHKTAQEKFEEAVAEVQSFVEIGLDPAVAEKEIERLRKEILDTDKDIEPKFAGLAELGSKEARDTILRHQFNFAKNDDPAKDVAAQTRRQADITERDVVPLLQQIRDNRPEEFSFAAVA